jgi:UMF1 family MFS transporter
MGRFLLARFFYSDAVNTIIVVMTVVATAAVGLSDRVATLVLLSLTIVAVVASFGWGTLVDRLGPKRTLVIVLVSWAIGLVIGGISLGIAGPVGLAMFLVAGGILGSGLGGVQVADRVLLTRLAPHERLGEFFGLYGLVGKGSQVIGLTLYGVVVALFIDRLGTGAYQLAVLSLLATMLIGLWLLRPVRDPGPDTTPSAGHDADGVAIPPERLAPAAAPLEPR